MRHAAVHIHQKSLTHNLTTLKNKLKPSTKLLAMVKADAYGHGVAAVVPALLDADGFGVACMSEAVAVADALAACKTDNDKPIVLIEGVFSQDEWKAAMTRNFGCVIHHSDQLAWALADVPDEGSHTRTIWLKYNTGMGRLGFDEAALIAAAKQLVKAGYRLILTSHFACADEKAHPMNAEQIAKFTAAYDKIRQFTDVQSSLCNSAGIINFPQAHGDWVRAGIALYGSTPVADCSANTLDLLPAMTLTAKLMALHQFTAGTSVGYGAHWQADTDSLIGVISIGYGDGYPRVVTDATVAITDATGKVHIRPIVGRVAMDMLMVDVSGIDVQIGAAVELWGNHISIDTIAAKANTIGYELMCRLTSRPTRLIDDEAAQHFK